MTLHERFNAIDITKGIIVLGVLFIGKLYPDQLPGLLTGKGNSVPVIITAGFILPALIFLTGITIPFSISKKINEGLTNYEISRHIFARALILITAGVMLVNTSRVDAGLTGFGSSLWTVLLVTAIFLVWNRYPENESKFFTISGLRLMGLAILVFIVFKFKSGTFENNGSLIPGWWEIPGLAGWAYLTGAFIWLAVRNSVSLTILLWLFFLSLNILDYLGFSGFLEPVKPFFGIITSGYIPFLVISGLLAGILLKKFSITDIRRPVLIILAVSLIMGISGWLLVEKVFQEGIYGNPGWSVCGVAVVSAFLALILWLDEIKKLMNRAKFLKSAGSNMLMLYILPFFFYNLVRLSGLDQLIFNSLSGVAAVSVALAWTLLMLWICLVLVRLNIRLKF